MKKHLVNNGSDTLLIFFTGWGCDEFEFNHLNSNSDILILYDYSNLDLDFDFSKYKKYNLIAFSAGVFIASVFNFDFNIGKKIAISGNPYLFDEYFGISKENQNILCSVTEENADDFARNYLVKTEDEFKKFHHSNRTIESCKQEFDSLKQLYHIHKEDIKNIFDLAIFGEDDLIFNLSAQKEFFKNKLKIIKNARHNVFFKIKKYDELLNYYTIKEKD